MYSRTSAWVGGSELRAGARCEHRRERRVGYEPRIGSTLCVPVMCLRTRLNSHFRSARGESTSRGRCVVIADVLADSGVHLKARRSRPSGDLPSRVRPTSVSRSRLLSEPRRPAPPVLLCRPAQFSHDRALCCRLSFLVNRPLSSHAAMGAKLQRTQRADGQHLLGGAPEMANSPSCGRCEPPKALRDRRGVVVPRRRAGVASTLTG